MSTQWWHDQMRRQRQRERCESRNRDLIAQGRNPGTLKRCKK